ncbi:hypothetical protein [Saccharibacillus sacchari]|uniref:hypothetical protein n=1 Tax=Saccharibacillus sacchari TaxID=456493 RepID=UPI00055C27A8|nr:hypothetical protein [Saccharibacillus sacchari]
MSINYGEELAYWYLRLNGFFTVNNFVLHHDEEHRTSDADILAVRFPYVYEQTGGQENDWDIQPFMKVEEDVIVGLICEVKTGPNYRAEELFKRQNLYRALGRFGFLENSNLCVDELNDKSYLKMKKYKIHKVLISDKKELPTDKYHHINLTDIKMFIEQRVHQYNYRKFPDRMFFQSPILQYIIWEQKLKER